jgi:hypothetical protein
MGQSNARATRVNTYGDEVVSISHPAGLAAGIYASVAPYGYLRTAKEPSALFVDPLDGGTLDTVNRWNTAGTAPTITGGAVSLAQTAASASSGMSTKAVFPPQGLSFNAFGWVSKFEAVSGSTVAALNTHRFMGIGTTPTTWSATYSASSTSGPLLDAIGFEVGTDGGLYAVVYANGVRTAVPGLTGATNLATGRTVFDGKFHAFSLSVRADLVFFYIDGNDVPVAIQKYSDATFVLPAVQSLPMRFHQINTATAPTTTPVFQVGSMAAADTAGSSIQLSDAALPFRKATIGAGGGLAVEPVPRQTYTANVRALSTIAAMPLFAVTGSATKTVRITRVSVSCTAGAASTTHLQLLRYTGAFTGGTAAAATVAPQDTNNATATATATGYSATPTTTTLAGMYATTGVTGTLLSASWQFGDIPEQQPTLRGTGQVFTIYNMAAISTSGSWHIVVEWTEE